MLLGGNGQGHELLVCCSNIHDQYARSVWLEGTSRASHETSYPAMMRQIIEQMLMQAGMTLDHST